MVNRFIFLGLFLLISTHLEAFYCYNPYNPSMCIEADCSLKARIAYFYPVDSKVRKIYSSRLFDQQLIASWKFYPLYEAWAEVDWFEKNGSSIGLNDPTRIRLIPISLGITRNFIITRCFDAYLGAGVSYSMLKLHDHDPYVEQNTFKNSFGALLKSGVLYHFNRYAFFDFFLDFYYQRFSFHDSQNPFVEENNVDLSGFKLGIGIGIDF